MKNVVVLILSCFLVVTSWNLIGAELADLESRGQKLVTGGKAAKLREIPYQVYLRDDEEAFCGGVILTEYAILTAAHCFYNVVGDIEVVAGTLGLQTPQGSPMSKGAQSRFVDRYDIHPQYKTNGKLSANDIALVRVSEPFVFNEYVTEAHLPEADAIYPEGKAQMSGWGPMKGDQKLNIAEVELLSREECADQLDKHIQSENWNDEILCANWTEQGRIEGGDSGGPLIKDGVVIGILSAGITSLRLEFFTRVSEYVDWIQRSGQLKDEL